MLILFSSFSSGDRQLVLNSYISSQWGEEVRFMNPFEEGKPFQVRILVCDKYFKVCKFKPRQNFSRLTSRKIHLALSVGKRKITVEFYRFIWKLRHFSDRRERQAPV